LVFLLYQNQHNVSPTLFPNNLHLLYHSLLFQANLATLRPLSQLSPSFVVLVYLPCTNLRTTTKLARRVIEHLLDQEVIRVYLFAPILLLLLSLLNLPQRQSHPNFSYTSFLSQYTYSLSEFYIISYLVYITILFFEILLSSKKPNLQTMSSANPVL